MKPCIILTRYAQFGAFWLAATDTDAVVHAPGAHLTSGIQLAVVDARIGRRAIADVLASEHAPRVVLVTDEYDAERELDWLSQGIAAIGYRSMPASEAHALCDVVRHGGHWVSRGALAQLVSRLHATPVENAELPLARLTSREREIVDLVATGSSNKEIARVLDISDRTVKTHLTNIFSKLGIADRVHLALALQSHG
ncbi:response regulator transcription factor [Chitinibacteraceae bacterium HSL-7]